MSDGELRQTMKRLMSIHDEIDEKKLDLKTVYADAKSAGFDKTALGLAIRQIRGREKNETPAAQERSAMVELYVSAFDNDPRTYVHVPAREGNQNTPERPSNRDVSAVDKSSSEAGPQAEASLAGTGSETLAGREGRPEEHPGSRPEMGVRAAQPVSQTTTPGSLTAAQSEAAAGSSPEQGADERTAGEGEVIPVQSVQFVTPAGEGEDAATSVDPSPVAERPKFARKEHVLRPHCLRPEMCGSYGSKHCAECERAAKASEDDGADVPAFVRKPHSHIAMGDQA